MLNDCKEERTIICTGSVKILQRTFVTISVYQQEAEMSKKRVYAGK